MAVWPVIPEKDRITVRTPEGSAHDPEYDHPDATGTINNQQYDKERYVIHKKQRKNR